VIEYRDAEPATSRPSSSGSLRPPFQRELDLGRVLPGDHEGAYRRRIEGSWTTFSVSRKTSSWVTDSGRTGLKHFRDLRVDGLRSSRRAFRRRRRRRRRGEKDEGEGKTRHPVKASMS